MLYYNDNWTNHSIDPTLAMPPAVGISTARHGGAEESGAGRRCLELAMFSV